MKRELVKTNEPNSVSARCRVLSWKRTGQPTAHADTVHIHALEQRFFIRENEVPDEDN